MKKLVPSFTLLFFGLGILFAQEIPCIEYEGPKYSTGPHPVTSPIFPGCESFKENNDSLNRCFGNEIVSRIADKMEMKVLSDTKIDGIISSIFRTKLIIRIDTSGKLKMYLINRVHTEFENRLVEKINEISEETFGIIPAKLEGGYCSSYSYGLPLVIDLTDEN